LVNKEIISEAGKGVSIGGGRKPNLYDINPNYGFIIALYFDDTNVRAVLANVIGDIKKDKIYEFDKINLDKIYKTIEDMYDIDNKNLKAIGLGIPGVVNNDGVVSNIPLVPDWEDLNLKEILFKKYKKQIFIENNVNMTGYGIFKDKYSQNNNNFVYSYFAEGVGAAIILNKKLYKGVNFFSGEIGYMLNDNFDNEQLRKNKNGVMENKVSEIIKRLRKQNKNNEDIKLKLNKIISFSLINIITFFDPDVIVIKNEFVDLNYIRNTIKSYLDLKTYPVIVQQENKNAGISGVISLCLSEMQSSYLLTKGNR